MCYYLGISYTTGIELPFKYNIYSTNLYKALKKKKIG
jgi:hypothetical protein